MCVDLYCGSHISLSLFGGFRVGPCHLKMRTCPRSQILAKEAMFLSLLLLCLLLLLFWSSSLRAGTELEQWLRLEGRVIKSRGNCQDVIREAAEAAGRANLSPDFL